MSSEGFAPITRAEVCQRLLSMRGIGIYDLGGGSHYLEASAFSRRKEDGELVLDCSGLLAWGYKYRRGRWNVNAILADALGPNTRWRRVRRDEEVRPGDALVRGGKDLDHNGVPDPGTHGHCGGITGVKSGFVRLDPDWYLDLEVTHCSGAGQNRIDPSTGKRYGAVRTQDATRWHLDGYIVRPLHLID